VRPGTQGVPGAIGLGIAAERAAAARATIVPRMTALRARMIDRARTIFPRLLVHGEPAGAPTPSANASPHIVSLGFPGVPAEPLLHALEARGVFVSAGSACAAKDKKPSAALRAIGVPDDVGTIRVSLSGRSTEAEIDTAAEVLRAALADLAQLPARSRR
jgi:cysteine desulfurase